MTTYADLGPYSDLVEASRGFRKATVTPDGVTPEVVCEALGFADRDPAPGDVRTERRWQRDGVVGEQVSWSVGFGPRTTGVVLRPVGVDEPLPGVLALHGHDGFTYYGREKISDGPAGRAPGLASFRQGHYAGRAFANELARRGFVVLAHDVFCWGSRRFPLHDMPSACVEIADAMLAGTDGAQTELPPDVARHNIAARQFEHVVEKYCVLLGTSMAGVVSYEDRIAAAYLAGRPDVRPGPLGCLGLSGGGARSMLLHATCDRIGAAVVVGMMSTYEGLLDHNVAQHTWMFFPAHWARHHDWPDLAAARAPTPLLVQYDTGDHLFTLAGMTAAHRALSAGYARTGHPTAYQGRFYDGPHRFDRAMQEDAYAWLDQHLRDAPGPGGGSTY